MGCVVEQFSLLQMLYRGVLFFGGTCIFGECAPLLNRECLWSSHVINACIRENFSTPCKVPDRITESFSLLMECDLRKLEYHIYHFFFGEWLSEAIDVKYCGIYCRFGQESTPSDDRFDARYAEESDKQSQKTAVLAIRDFFSDFSLNEERHGARPWITFQEKMAEERRRDGVGNVRDNSVWLLRHPYVEGITLDDVQERRIPCEDLQERYHALIDFYCNGLQTPFQKFSRENANAGTDLHDRTPRLHLCGLHDFFQYSFIDEKMLTEILVESEAVMRAELPNF